MTGLAWREPLGPIRYLRRPIRAAPENLDIRGQSGSGDIQGPRRDDLDARLCRETERQRS